MQVYLYGFTISTGSSLGFEYVNSSLYVTSDNILHVYGGITYNASSIICKEYTYDLKEVMGEANLQIPYSQCGFLAGAASRTIEGPVRVVVYEYDTVTLNAIMVFRGFINTFKVSKSMVDLQCVSFVEHARDNFARLQLSRVCQHRLYSPLCGVNIENYMILGTIEAYSIDRTTMEVSGIDSSTGYFTYGGLEWEGVFRHVLNDVWTGTIRQMDLMHFLPAAWEIGQQVFIIPGCDKLTSTCKSKYGNFTRYMGFPYAPYESIRYTGLRAEELSTSKKK